MIQKQALAINFAKGLDQKTDPWQVSPDRFLALSNSVFTKGGRLTKRNGFGLLSSVPEDATELTTYQGNLTALGNSFYAYNSDGRQFIDKGAYRPLSLETLSLIKNNFPQTQCDSATAPNGTVCVVYTEDQNGSNAYKYSVIDGNTGQILIAPADIVPASGSVTGSPRVFILGNNFIVVFTVTITGSPHLQYFPIGFVSFSVGSATDISATYTPDDAVAFDGTVMNNSLYLAWNSSGAAGILMTKLTASLVLAGTTNVDAAHTATTMSVSNDGTRVYAAYYDSGTMNGYVLCVDEFVGTIFTATQWVSGEDLSAVTSVGTDAGCTIFYETVNDYSFASIRSDYTSYVTVTPSGVVGANTLLKRSVGLASKAFVVDGIEYVLCAYESPYQPTYFLIDIDGNIISQLAYQNGGGYLATGLPSVTVIDNVASVAYLYKDFVSSLATGTTNVNQTANIYFQTGISLAYFTIGGVNIHTAEIGNTLNASGGFLWTYDGSSAVENGFFLYPDSVAAAWSATGGSIVAKPDGATNTNAYFYQVTYEWSDNQGNQYRSTPSLPVSVTTTGSGSSGSITVSIPTLRLSYKTDVKICVYRWSVAQQVYYQTTSITSPTMNSTSVNSIDFVDTNADASILGNNILYTTGGVIENTSTPAPKVVTLFDNRLWMVDSENPNVLWYSKQVLQNTPVEMSDLLTLYISPTQSAQGATGPITAIAPMDDKLIIFKEDAIYYINGTGPDNTGANSQYSQAIFITATVGSENQNSIVFTPNGLMFQSDKGIWLLGRNLETTYIGNPVEDYTLAATVNSAANIPATNQVRFTLSDGKTLMYDYFFGQWGTFNGARAISSTIYQDKHTLLSPYSQALQETPQSYLDVTSPVLMSFTTAWINLAGLQGYQRAFFFYLIGQYYSPHELQLNIAYDYSPGPLQSTIITPTNYGGVYGGADPNPADGTDSSDPYGQDATFGGTALADDLARGAVEQWRVFLAKQKCQAFQITLNEIYDPSYGVAAGQGLTLSGLNLVYGIKKGFRPIAAANSTGSGGNNV